MLKQTFTITIDKENKTAVDFISAKSELSASKIKRAMQKGCVWLETSNSSQSYIQRLRRAKKLLKPGDTLYVYYDEKILSQSPKPAELIHDAGSYSIWNKPSGMYSQGSKWGDHCTIYRWAESHLKPERSAFLVHRLDRAAKGLMILAHKKSIANDFSKLFKRNQIEKHYNAIVKGDFSSAANEMNKKIIDLPIEGKQAKSIIKFISYDADNNHSMLLVNIETGRKHQIRKHLSSIGFPIVGDRLYGESNDTDLQLTSVTLKFICPVSGKDKEFKLGF